MAVFKEIPMGDKGLKEMYSWIDGFVAENRKIAYKRSLGKTQEEWDVPAVYITNSDIPDEDKQIAIATLSRHGNEFGARVVGPEIINYLASDEAEDIRNTQIVIVVPVVNPDGFVRGEFNSSRYGITKNELSLLGPLFKECQPDMIIDFHSLGKSKAPKYDGGDIEVIIPSNPTKWAMDEQIHQYVANKMRDAAGDEGWPYEIHNLEDLWAYYFGGDDPGTTPWTYLQEKVFLLQMQDFHDNFDIPESGATRYNNYTNGPAYMKWHTLVFGIETNHWGIKEAGDIATSGLAPCKALLKMGSERFSWEKDRGYPVNILHGDFRNSIRPVGHNASECRASRTRIWQERKNFNMPFREMPDQDTTVAKVRYFGKDLPMDFALCLRLRKSQPVNSIVTGYKKLAFETFEDSCSTFVYIPLVMDAAGIIEITIKH